MFGQPTPTDFLTNGMLAATWLLLDSQKTTQNKATTLGFLISVLFLIYL